MQGLRDIPAMKEIHPLVLDIQSRIFAHRLRVLSVMSRAGVDASTWWRWTQGAEPKLGTLDRVNRAIDEAIEETRQ